MSNFPWQASPEIPAAKQTLTDPVSGVAIELPKLGGLTVNEMLFAQWLGTQDYAFIQGDLNSEPQNVKNLVAFCHQFLCLRLGLADWVDDALQFIGESVTQNESLTMIMPSGLGKAAPLYILYLIYGFFVEEQSTWLGKPDSKMIAAIVSVLEAKQTGQKSTGSLPESTQGIPDLPEPPLEDAPSPSSKAPSRQRTNQGLNDLETKAA